MRIWQALYHKYKPQAPPGGGGTGNNGGGSIVFDKQAIIPAPQLFEEKEETQQNKVFSDLSDAAWAVDAIHFLSGKNYINGYDDGTFAPLKTMTREEFVALVLRGFDLLDAEAVCSFTDVNENEWYYRYVASAFSDGIVNGLNDEQFGIGMPITRQDAAVILTRAMEHKKITPVKKREYESFADDETISDYAVESIKNLYTFGIINGDNNKNFNPAANIRRAECCVMLTNILSGGTRV